MKFRHWRYLPLALLLLALAACGNPQEEARLKLGQKKIPYNADAFINYARGGNLEVVRLFLLAGMSPEVTSKIGDIPLVEAARYDRGAVVKLLLAKGADPNVTDLRQGATPLMWAAVRGYDGVVQLLLANGAKVNARNPKNGMTALMSAALGGKAGAIKLLLAKGANVNATDNINRTALILAAHYGHAEAARVLLDQGADPAIQEKLKGMTPSCGPPRTVVPRW
jgi:ankyrin repeat protein